MASIGFIRPERETDHDCSAKGPPLHSSLDSQGWSRSPIVILIVGSLVAVLGPCGERGTKRRPSAATT